MVVVNLLMLVVVVIFYLIGKRNRARTAEALAENERVIDGLAGKLRQSATQLLRLSEAAPAADGADASSVAEEIRDSGNELSKLADDMRAYSGLLRQQREEEARWGRKRRAASTSAPSRGVRNAIVFTLLAAMAVALVFCVRSTANWGDTRMGREADKYENQLDEWLTQQRSILYMFTDIISSKPELLADYDGAVRWLNGIVVKYPEISACYLANPYADPPVIMNTGWLPGKDERPETRPWYQATERAADGFNISAPYMDAQTGNYCVTLSRVVYGENNEFLGIFGIDFFLDKLINVLGESYTSASYAFLVDSDHVIINHPNADYQMRGDASTSVEDTEYAEAYHRQGVTTLRDYSGQLLSCLCRRTDAGFSILVANRWWSIYGGIFVVALGLLLMFCVIIIVIVALINRLIRWQEGVNGQLREAMDAAVNANRAKSQFLSQMSHEIRTPMNAIIGLDNIALRDPDIAPRTREQLEKIDASARHLLSLINDILDMSRIESGRMVLKEERFPFREFLDQICVIVGGQCADKGLRFECQAADDVEEYLVGDDLKLKQVLINILGNAVKFTDAPGLVTFIIEETDRRDDDCRLRFTMKDTGIGMDREFLPKLFEAFSQEDATTTNRYGGSGLGMAITRNIVEMMGGEISVESEKGRGSTFVVSVPLKRARQAERPADSAEAAPGEEPSLAGLHLLIAEDIELNAEVLIDLLEMEEITCEWAENGERAVAIFGQSEENHFDAVLMDMRMPVMDGLAATRAIRKLDRPDAKTVPIIALTANAFEDDSQRCLEAGMDAHLSKPVDIEALKKTLGRLLGTASKQRIAES